MGKKIDELSCPEAISLLNKIADAFSIGSNARTESVLLTNVQNAANHAWCIKPPSVEVAKAAITLPGDNLIRRYIFDAAGSWYCDSCNQEFPDCIEGVSLGEVIYCSDKCRDSYLEQL